MDDKLKQDEGKQVDQRRLEIFRKARRDANKDARDENEANYNKRVDQLNKKDKKTEVILDDGDDFLKGLKTYGEDDGF